MRVLNSLVAMLSRSEDEIVVDGGRRTAFIQAAHASDEWRLEVEMNVWSRRIHVHLDGSSAEFAAFFRDAIGIDTFDISDEESVAFYFVNVIVPDVLASKRDMLELDQDEKWLRQLDD